MLTPPYHPRAPGWWWNSFCFSPSPSLSRQFSKVFRSGSCVCSRQASAAPILQSPILRSVLLRRGSCLALGRRRPVPPSPTLKWPSIRSVLFRFGRLFAAGMRPRLRNTSGVQHNLFCAPGAPRKAPERCTKNELFRRDACYKKRPK